MPSFKRESKRYCYYRGLRKEGYNISLSKCEQEVVINFNAEDNTATLYSSNPVWIRKMDKLVEQNPEQFKMYRQETVKGKVVSKFYELPKEFVTIRSKKRSCNLTDEQKQERAERMRQSKINSI